MATARNMASEFRAEAFVFCSDGWQKNPENPKERIGEVLSAAIHWRWGNDGFEGISMAKTYTRDPFEFSPIKEGVGGLLAHRMTNPNETVH